MVIWWKNWLVQPFTRSLFLSFGKLLTERKMLSIKILSDMQNLMLKTLIKDTNTLKVKKYNIFGTSIVTCATKKQ